MRLLISFVLILFIQLAAKSQIERGGVPRSFQASFGVKSSLKVVEIPSPDSQLLEKEDLENTRLEKAYRVGVEIPVSVSMADGQWDQLPDGRLWRVVIKCASAQGLGLYFNKMRLPEGSDLFIYSFDKEHIIGAFTAIEVGSNYLFTSRPVYGDEIVIEYFEPLNVTTNAEMEVSGISYIYRGFEPFGMKSSGFCEVNINCPEGDNWQKQKRGVVKILTKVGSSLFYCTGSILNNTANDFAGLLLSAAHCASSGSSSATTEDYNQWVFYFNYESPGCINSGVQELSLTGAQKLAIADNSTDMGSDFLLLQLTSSIPPGYKPFYCGWDVGSGNSSSGVGIHHPDGDIKKISTYTTPLLSGTWGGTPGTHWVVKWSATSNGHGVTEGGSSGSPLFDDEGLVIGTLTGGESDCQSPEETDSYGKISYSWTSNGATSIHQLKPWLDPENTGWLKMPGTFDDKLTVADFSADRVIVPINGYVNFHDLSSGTPFYWHWFFESGIPSESFDKNPSGIQFSTFGKNYVKLVVTNAFNTDSIVKEGFIKVNAVVSPNPGSGNVNVLVNNTSSDLIIEVYNSSGIQAQRFEFLGYSAPSYNINLPSSGNMFMLKVIQDDHVQVHKVIVVR